LGEQWREWSIVQNRLFAISNSRRSISAAIVRSTVSSPTIDQIMTASTNEPNRPAAQQGAQQGTTAPQLAAPQLAAPQLAAPQLAARQLAATDLAQRAVRKLGQPPAGGEWSVSRRALQQATAWQVANLKAGWFGDRVVYDLCCGIGGDCIALAKRGPVVAVDSDPQMVAMVSTNLALAGANLAPAGMHQVQVRCADVTTLVIPGEAAIHIDPDRRPTQRRTICPENYLPAWDHVERIVRKSPSAVVKLAPAAWFDDHSLPASHRCWISLRGSVREQSVLCGEALTEAHVTTGTRSAVALRSDGTHRWFRPTSDSDVGAAATVDQPGRFLVDPDAAIRAAELTAAFATDFGCQLLHRPTDFLTVDELTADIAALAVTGEVIWSGACDDRKLRREFRGRNLYPQTIKVRGSDHDPAKLAKRYRNCGEMPITLWIGRTAKRVFAAMTTSVA
jgi:SAM-dependent methyltransferase